MHSNSYGTFGGFDSNFGWGDVKRTYVGKPWIDSLYSLLEILSVRILVVIFCLVLVACENKNEANQIPAPEIVVAAGSTDKTIEIAQESISASASIEAPVLQAAADSAILPSTPVPWLPEESKIKLEAHIIPIGGIPTNFNIPSLVISPNFKRIAYTVNQDDGWFAFVDGKKSQKYTDACLTEKCDCPDQGCPYTKFVFSPDSKRVAYVGDLDGRSIMIVDGEEEKSYELAGFPIFSPDSKHLAYVAVRDKASFIVYDGKEGSKYKSIGGYISPTFSRDGQLAYTAQKGKDWFAVVGGKVIGKYDEISEPVFSSMFSPDGKRTVFAGKRANKWFAVVDGKEGAPYEYVYISGFSPDSQRVAYLAQRNNRQFIVVDGKEGTALANASYAIFSPDSQHFAYAANQTIVLDDKVISPYYGALSTPAFSPDSEHIAYMAARDGKTSIVVDGNEGPWGAYTVAVGPIFSPDSKRVAYIVQYYEKLPDQLKQRWFVVVNEKNDNAIYESDYRLIDISFNGDSAISAVGVNSDRVAHIEIQIKQ